MRKTLTLVPKSVVSSYIATLVERENARAAFVASERFSNILLAMVNNPEPVTLDDESLKYFPDKAKAEAGLEFATAEDLELFMDVLATPDARTVTPESGTRDSSCSFDNVTFEHFGLIVWMMFGQGTAVTIFNRAEVLRRSSAASSAAPAAPTP